ncbi:miaA [Mytilus coruscus]|uniref:MiaA n=1 Tax=Mytilus coruscus TaxID=42192 RepID=A0A6J7ZWM4_MYTCO|nr:miaA [Mytilus coruscus]
MQEETLMNWSNELAKFVVTKASQSIYQRIQMDKLVAIIGSTGTGKSACAKNIALRLKNEYGYTIVSARQPSDITQYVLPGTNQVFIIDDFIGKNAFDEAEAVSWEEGPFIYKILSTNDQTKVILTCRKSIWNPEICERFRLSASVCDLHTDELRLTLLERRTICEAYLEKSYINAIKDEIIIMYPFLPSLCSIFSSKTLVQ